MRKLNESDEVIKQLFSFLYISFITLRKGEIKDPTVVDTKFGPPTKKMTPDKKSDPPDKKNDPPPPEKWSMPSPDNYKNLDEIILNPTYNN